MLSINVRNFRGIRLAELNAERIALLCGLNEQGKSSIIDGVRALLDGTQAPYGLTKAELEGQLLFSGSQQAEVSMTDGSRQAVMRWPAGTLDTQGAPFRSTLFATGTKRFTDLNERERAQTLAQYLKTDPTDEEFRAAAKAQACTDDLTVVWADIQKLGWDGAWQKYRQDATKLKGAWEGLTGASYGSKVGAIWRPRGWGPDHEALTDAEAAENLKEATDRLEAAIGKVAIGKDEKNRLESLVKQIPKLQDLLKIREADGARAKSTREKALEEYQQVPVVEPDDWPACPHCKKPVAVRAGKNNSTVLEIPKKTLDAKERKKLVDEAADKEGVYREADKALEDARNSYRVVENDLQKATDAKLQLEQEAGSDGVAVDLDELRNDVKAAQSVIAGKQKVRDALKRHMEVISKLALVDVLSPEGVRSAKLTEKIDGFNALLAQLCAVADWAEVRVAPDGEVSLDNIRYALCSGSGRFRCDLTLQVAFAQLDGSEVLLVDEADILDAKGRNGLFALLSSSEKYCVVAMMLTKIGTTPDLAKAGLGASYWVDGATSQELEVAQQAA